MTKSSISLSAESIKSVQRGKQIAFLTLPLSSSTENSMNYRLVGSKGIFHLVLQVNTSIVLSLLFSEWQEKYNDTRVIRLVSLNEKYLWLNLYM